MFIIFPYTFRTRLFYFRAIPYATTFSNAHRPGTLQQSSRAWKLPDVLNSGIFGHLPNHQIIRLGTKSEKLRSNLPCSWLKKTNYFIPADFPSNQPIGYHWFPHFHRLWRTWAPTCRAARAALQRWLRTCAFRTAEAQVSGKGRTLFRLLR